MLPLVAVLVLVLSGQPQDVLGRCVLETESPAPLVVTSFGSKSFVSGKPGFFEREYYENIVLYCGGGFTYKIRFVFFLYLMLFTRSLIKTFEIFWYAFRDYNGNTRTTSDTKITLNCNSNDEFYFRDYYVTKISCQKRVNQMFESVTKLPNCENEMSLVLGYDFGYDIGYLKNAALCYDIMGSKLKYFGYTTFPSKNRILETVRSSEIRFPNSYQSCIFCLQTQVGQLNQLGLDINVTYNTNLIRHIDQLEIDKFMTMEKQVASLFVKDAFQYASLAEDGQQLDGYEDMLATVWLRVLRSGNWAHWLAAMRVASDAGGHFDVRMGVSGTLQLPAAAVGPCNASRSLVIGLRDGAALPVPAHIWAHVRALEPAGGAHDEFVLIGHNSPFFRSDNSSAMCSSMCDQVPWLRSSLFASLHEFPAYGLVQCCRVEDVAHKLDNFPGPYVDATAARRSTTTTTTA
ncbi:hypothetical protein KR054_010480, partial [Drosophila jambulina]